MHVSPRSIEATNWSAGTVKLDVDRQTIMDGPAYDQSKDFDRAFEIQWTPPGLKIRQVWRDEPRAHHLEVAPIGPQSRHVSRIAGRTIINGTETMALDHIRGEVSMMVAEVNKRLAQADKLLEEGTMREKVDAAGELAVLRQRKAIVEAREKEIDALPADALETPLRWLREEVFNLNVQLQSWISGG